MKRSRPMKCPKCPVKNYYGALLLPNHSGPDLTCPNCSTVLVPVRRK